MLNLTPYCFSNNHRQKLTCILGSFDKRKNWELITIRANFCQGKHVYLLFICFEDFCSGFVSFLRGHPSQIGANNLFEVLSYFMKAHAWCHGYINDFGIHRCS